MQSINKKLLKSLEHVNTFQEWTESLEPMRSKEKGDLFEYFAYYVLTICYDDIGFDRIYLYNMIPKWIKKKYKLPKTDEGVDIICIKDDELYGVQCKFRATQIKINCCDINTFLKFCEKCNIKNKILITNCEYIYNELAAPNNMHFYGYMFNYLDNNTSFFWELKELLEVMINNDIDVIKKLYNETRYICLDVILDWNFRYTRLYEWMEEHFRMPLNNIEEYETYLFQWCDEQCLYYEKKVLCKEKISKLENIDAWCWKENKYSTLCFDYAQWVREHNMKPRLRDKGKGNELAVWMDRTLMGKIGYGCSWERNYKLFNALCNWCDNYIKKFHKRVEKWIRDNNRLPSISANDNNEKKYSEWLSKLDCDCKIKFPKSRKIIPRRFCQCLPERVQLYRKFGGISEDVILK